MAQQSRGNRWPIIIALCALAYLVGVVFFPVFGFEFVELDELVHVIQNPDIQGLTWANVKHILTSRCLTSYYPVRTLTYAVDYQIWGSNAGGFKLTNVLIHLGNVFLVFGLTLRLLRQWHPADSTPQAWFDVCVAAVAAAIFAVHPVVVEPVAWVSGREELLMTLGALGCIHFHLSAQRSNQAGERHRRVLVFHLAAILCCAVACLSNAVAAVIPLLVVACDVLMPQRPKVWKIVRDTLPLWILSIVTIALKISGKDTALIGEPGAFSAQRLILVLNVYWANLRTLVWPRELGISYSSLRPGSLLEPEVILGAVALGTTCAVLWIFRRQRVVILGLLWFGIALGPASQIMVHPIHLADRFLYLPLAGVAISAGGWLRMLRYDRDERQARRVMIAAGIAGLSVVFVLVTLSAHQVQTWRNSITLWEQCVKAAPDNPAAHKTFADSLAKSGQVERAVPEYEIALELDPYCVDALRNFAFHLVTRDGLRAIQLAERGCKLTGRQDRGLLRILARAYASQATALYERGQSQQALGLFNRAIEVDPGYELPWIALAHLRATCPDPELRDPAKAAQLAERAGRMATDPRQLSVLGEVYAAIGQFDRAIAIVIKAQQIAQTAGHRELAESLERQCNEYRAQSLQRGSL